MYGRVSRLRKEGSERERKTSLRTAMKETQLSGKKKKFTLSVELHNTFIAKAEKWFLVLWENEDGAVSIVKQSHTVFPDVGSSLKKGSICDIKYGLKILKGKILETGKYTSMHILL